MNATSLYVTTSRLVFQQNHDNGTDQSWTDLYRLVPYLRQSLSCTVCGRMLIEPYKPSDGKCQHHICRGCVRGRKNLKPTCIWCRDNFNLDKYEENTQMRLLLQCYKSLCQYIMSTPIFQLISSQTNSTGSGIISNGVAIPNATLLEFIEEGACFQDNFKPNSGLTKTAYSILPCVFSPPVPTSTQSISQQQHQTQSQASFNRHQSPSLLTSTPTPSPPSYVQQQQTQFSQVYQAHQSSPSNNTNSTSISTVNSNKNYQEPPPLALVNNMIYITPTTTTTTAITNHSTVSATVSNSSTKNHIKNNIKGASSSSCSLTTASSNHSKILNQNQLQQLQQIQIHNNVINVPAACTATASVVTPVEQKITTVTAPTAPSLQISNPPPIKTVSNGSAMYSVLYTGIGNKITIKRKTDGDDENTSKKYTNFQTPTRPVINNNKTLISSKRRGCRCGNATATPGKLTCCGQRCPCYVDSKSCVDCKCRGCRNPHRPDGGKIRPMIPELACYEIQMADDSTNLTTSTSANSSQVCITNTTTPQSQQFQQSQQQQQQSHIAASNFTTIATQATQKNNNKQNRVEISLEDFNNTNLSSLINSNGILCNNSQNSLSLASGVAITATSSNSITTTTHVIPMIKKSTQQQQQQQHQHQTTYAFTTNQLKRHPSSQIQQQTVNLENASRESLLIKSADGKYQVVNVYTSTPHQTTNLQRYHTIQTTINNSNKNNNLNTVNTISGLQLHHRNINQSPTQTHQIPEISTTLPQLLLQPQQQQQQQNNNNSTILTSSGFHNNQQQQNHQHNVNALISSTHQHQQQLNQPPATITLSPIIVTSGLSSNFPTELFNDGDHLGV